MDRYGFHMYTNVDLVRPNRDGLTSKVYPQVFDPGRICVHVQKVPRVAIEIQ